MKKIISYGTILCLMLLPVSGMAANFTWVNWVGDQNWVDGGNWNQEGVAPTAADDTHFNQGPGVLGAIVSTTNAVGARLVMDHTVTVTVAAGGELTVTQALLGNPAGSVDNDLVVDGGVLNITDTAPIGVAGNGSITVNSGTLNATGDWLIAGYDVGGSGDIVVNGGTVNAKILYAGNNGDGGITVNGGVVNAAGVLVVALANPTTGHVTVNGGVLSVTGFNVGENDGTGIVDLNGGQLINTGGFVQNTNAVFNFAGGELVFTSSTLADVNWAIDNGGGTWNFAEFRSVVSNAQGVVVSSIAIPPTEAATIVSSTVSNNLMKIVVDTPSGVHLYHPMASSNLATGAWGSIPHSDDGVNAFVVTNLEYSTADASGTNEVIYVQVDYVQKFFKVDGEQP